MPDTASESHVCVRAPRHGTLRLRCTARCRNQEGATPTIPYASLRAPRNEQTQRRVGEGLRWDRAGSAENLRGSASARSRTRDCVAAGALGTGSERWRPGALRARQDVKTRVCDNCSIQMRVNTCMPENVSRVTSHLETRITDTSFA